MDSLSGNMCIKQGLTYVGEGWCDQNLGMGDISHVTGVEQNVILFLGEIVFINEATLCYLVVKVFILKLVPIDALSSGSILIRKVSTLDHKFLDD